MTDNTAIRRTISVVEPQFIALEELERKSEYLTIKYRIVTRPLTVGVYDVETLIPRVWSGYWYLLYQNSIERRGRLEFEAETIYRERSLWLSETQTNTYSVELGTADADANELIDEAAVLALFDEQPEAGQYYLPFPHTIDLFAVWFPPGVEIQVIIEALPFSKVVVPGSGNDVDITASIQEPDELALPPLMDINMPADLIPFCSDLISDATEDPNCRSVFLLGITYTVTSRLIIDRNPGFSGTATPYVAYEIGGTFTLTKTNNPLGIAVISTGTVTSYPSLSDAQSNTNGTIDANNNQQWGCGYVQRSGQATID